MNLNEHVPATVLAEALNLKKSRINEMVANGLFHPIGNPRKYVFVDALHAYINYLRGRIDPSREEQAAIETAKLKADTAYKATRANVAQLKLAELEGKMHRADDVRDAFEGLVYNVRSSLMALPGRAAIDVVGIESSAEAADVLRKLVNEILQSLENYQYDPEFYATRVREREGWLDGGANDGSEDS